MKEFQQLIAIMARLRNRENGCPWDLKQSESSLREYVLEEAYELIDAIDSGSPEKMCEELGDLLLQVVFLAQIQQEKKNFDINNVLETINRKLISRHPHIFADLNVTDADEVKRNWEKIKMKEKKKESILSDYPEAMPALLTASRISSQASSVGFDWNDARQALEKVKEEIGEIEQALPSGDMESIQNEIGDLLFAVANVSRLLRFNPEFALRQANQKFIRRFRFIERKLKKEKKSFSETKLTEMEELWQQSKREEK